MCKPVIIDLDTKRLCVECGEYKSPLKFYCLGLVCLKCIYRDVK